MRRGCWRLVGTLALLKPLVSLGQGYIDDSESVDDELAPSQLELRAERRHVVGLGLGEVLPWQQAAVRYGRLLDDNLLLAGSLAGGFIQQKPELDEVSFNATLRTYSLSSTLTFWPSANFPLAIAPGLSIARVGGHMSTILRTPTEDAWNTKYDGFALTTFFSLNFTHLTVSGWYWEWLIVGFAKNVFVQINADDDRREPEVRRYLAIPRVYGLTNLMLGYAF